MTSLLDNYIPKYDFKQQYDDWQTPEYVAVILLNVNEYSLLANLLIAHRFNKGSDGKKLVQNGELIENWTKERYKKNPEYENILKEIAEKKGEFTELFIKYLALESTLRRSDVIMNPETSKLTDDKEDYFLKVSACIEWARNRNYPIHRSIINAYNNVYADLVYTMPTITRENDINKCVLDVIKSFEKANGYPPTSHEEVINRLRFKPTPDVTVKFSEGGKIISFNNQEFSNTQLKSAIKYLLGQIKISTSTNC